MPPCKPSSPRYRAAAARLRELYAAGGCLRLPNEYRRRHETWRTYKHGYELRFKPWDKSESAEILRLLRIVGIDTGRPYLDFGRPVIPVYGENRVRKALCSLRLKRSPREARKRRVAEPRESVRATARWQGTATITSLRQLDVAGLLDHRGPLAAAELGTTGSVLALLERRGLIEPTPADGSQPTRWRLTRKGRKETRRARKSHLDWMRATPSRRKRRHFPDD